MIGKEPEIWKDRVIRGGDDCASSKEGWRRWRNTDERAHDHLVILDPKRFGEKIREIVCTFSQDDNEFV